MTTTPLAPRAGMLFPYRGIWPTIAPSAYIAPGAVLIGDVHLGEECSVWSNAVLRGDMAPVYVGQGANVQENATVHVDADTPATIGAFCVVGHNAIVHGCTVEPGCMVAMHATLLNRCVIGSGSIIAAAALVSEDAIIPARSMVMGLPGKVRRDVTEEEVARVRANAERYIALSRHYLAGGMGRVTDLVRGEGAAAEAMHG